MFRNFDQNHGLTPFKICKFFIFSYFVFLWSKKAPFAKKTSSKDEAKVSLTEK